MSTAGLFPWLQLERQTKTPGVGTPAQDLVKSLIGIQERRELRDRLKRQEERQARLDQIAEEKRQRDQEWEDVERRQAIAAQTSGLEKATQEILSNIVPVALGTAEQPAPPPAEREKVTTKTGPDGSQTVSVDRPLAETPVDPKNQLPEDLINLNLGPELDLGGGPQTPGVPEILPLQERMTQEILRQKDPMTSTYQGQEIVHPYMEEVLRREQLETLMSPGVTVARINAEQKESPEQRQSREIAVAEARAKANARYKKITPKGYDPITDPLSGRVIGRFNNDTGESEMFDGAGVEMPEPMRDALGNISLSLPTNKQRVLYNEVERRMKRGDLDSAKEAIVTSALSNENVKAKDNIRSRMATINILNYTENALKQLQESGVPTNLLRGTAEDVARALGKTTNPEWVRLGGVIKQALFAYRLAMTGVQFSEKESQTYEKLFPNFKNELPVNLNLIQGMRDGFSMRNRTYWESRLGSPELADYLVETEDLTAYLPKSQAPVTEENDLTTDQIEELRKKVLAGEL